jgi:molecular chaperone DnaK
MKAEAEMNAESDRIEKEKIDKLNSTDSLIFQTEKNIKEFSDKLTDEDKSNLELNLTDLKNAFNLKDLTEIENCTNKLNDTWNKKCY